MADSVATLGVDLRAKVKSLGAKEEARRKKCIVEFSLVNKKKAFQKSHMKVGVKMLLRADMMPSRTWRVHAVGMSLAERFLIEEANGGCCGYEEYNFPLLVCGNTRPQS